jgi:hypothetical protein
VPSKGVFRSAPLVLVCLFLHLRIFCERKENKTVSDSVIAEKCVEYGKVSFPFQSLDGFGGLVVSMLASGSRVRGFKSGRSRWIFLYIKILSLPSFGGDIK